MNVPIPRPRVAIVGSREATPQGIEDADLITRILVDKGVTIVSGLAKGIDAAAHKAAIRAGGQTIAVLGTTWQFPNFRRVRLLHGQTS